MRKTRIMLLLPASIGLKAAAAVVLFREREPDYDGRSLSSWVIRCGDSRLTGGDAAAQQAITKIGTNALPFLLRWIQLESSAHPFRKQMRVIFAKQPKANRRKKLVDW